MCVCGYVEFIFIKNGEINLFSFVCRFILGFWNFFIFYSGNVYVYAFIYIFIFVYRYLTWYIVMR